MSLKKFATLASSSVLALTISNGASAFAIDLDALTSAPTFADPSADGDRIASSTVDATEYQFNLPVNVITVAGFDFTTTSVGSTYSFTDVGSGSLTIPLPVTVFADNEGYLTEWEITTAFSLGGVAEVTSFNAITGEVDFDFSFTSGSLDLFYDEIVNGIPDAAANQQQVLAASLTSGGGDAVQTVGSATQDAGSFVADFFVNDLMDGFWLDELGSPFLDGWTLAFTDGNINQTTVTSYIPGTALEISARSDGSISFGQVPEPSSIALLGIGLLGLGSIARKRTK